MQSFYVTEFETAKFTVGLKQLNLNLSTSSRTILSNVSNLFLSLSLPLDRV